jgi:large subunit ribosomal protein L30
MSDLIAVVRIRGIRNIKPTIRKTLELLKLEKPNCCIVLNPTPQMMGMVNLIKDYVAFGNIKTETHELLKKKRGKENSKAFRLKPPRHGLKNVKLAYPLGDLGKRDDMDSLISRMV